MRQSNPHKKCKRSVKIKFKDERNYGKVLHNMRVKEYFVINPLKFKTKLNFIFRVPGSTVQ